VDIRSSASLADTAIKNHGVPLTVILTGFLRSVRILLSVVVILATSAGIIGLTWRTANRTIEDQRSEAEQRTKATVDGVAASYAEQLGRQIMALDQALDTLVRDQEADPRRFNLEAARERARILTGIARDMFLADENGVIRQSSVSDFLGQSVADLTVFRDAVEHTDDKPRLYLGSASVNPMMRQWHMDAARTLHHPDGSFAGIIDTDYRLAAVTNVLASGIPPGNSFAALSNVTDGKLRAAYGAAGSLAAGTTDANIADTPLFAAIDAGGSSGKWVGPSATDAVTRIHAFRRLPDRDLAVIVGIDEQDAFRQVDAVRWQARLYAATVSGLTVMIAGILLIALGANGRRARRNRETTAKFAAAQALAEVSRVQADAISRRLHAMFAAVGDGVAIFDAHLNLVEWNARFPDRAGVNASFIRTGMPMEDVLRMQAEDGCFGVAANIEAEVERRTALLRAGNFGASQAFQARDRTVELRCRPLDEGGFVALYTDVTEGRRARQALREANDALARERAARTRILGAISHELRVRVAMLTRTLSVLRAPDMASGPRGAAIERVRRVGESLGGLATDAVEVPKMEVDAIAFFPALLTVRPLLQEALDAVQPVAEYRGVTAYQVVGQTAPVELVADPNRVRQILTLLLSEAMRFASPDTLWLIADGGADENGERHGLRVVIRCFGTPIPRGRQAEMFPALRAIAPPEDAAALERGSGLGPAIARYLTTRMGGHLRCESWSTADGRTGNDFILSLPEDVLPGQRGRPPGHAPTEGRPLPRTRVLLAGVQSGLRMAAVTMLRRDSHMVDTVATGEAVMRALEGSPYDIVFLDVDLPDMSLAELVRALRDTPGPARTVPIVVLAPPHDEADARAWRDLGIADILPAAPTLDEFTGAIARDVWLANEPGSRMGSMPGLDGETEEGVPILDAGRVAELRANIRPEELGEIVEECIADLFHRLPALRRALAARARGAIAAQAHAMVGMAGGYGMAVLEARLRAILVAVRLRRLDTIDGAAEVVEADLNRAAAALRRAVRAPLPARSGGRK
jgi:signal transduction histidine kinase/CheY-like chemotaxis protein